MPLMFIKVVIILRWPESVDELDAIDLNELNESLSSFVVAPESASNNEVEIISNKSASIMELDWGELDVSINTEGKPVTGAFETTHAALEIIKLFMVEFVSITFVKCVDIKNV